MAYRDPFDFEEAMQEIRSTRAANKELRAENEWMREALEQTYAALLPHKSTVLRWYTPTDQALDAARAALDKP